MRRRACPHGIGAAAPIGRSTPPSCLTERLSAAGGIVEPDHHDFPEALISVVRHERVGVASDGREHLWRSPKQPDIDCSSVPSRRAGQGRSCDIDGAPTTGRLGGRRDEARPGSPARRVHRRPGRTRRRAPRRDQRPRHRAPRRDQRCGDPAPQRHQRCGDPAPQRDQRPRRPSSARDQRCPDRDRRVADRDGRAARRDVP